MDINRALRIVEGCMLIEGHFDYRREAVETIRAALAEVQKPAHNSQSKQCFHSSHFSTSAVIKYCPDCGVVVG